MTDLLRYSIANLFHSDWLELHSGCHNVKELQDRVDEEGCGAVVLASRLEFFFLWAEANDD